MKKLYLFSLVVLMLMSPPVAVSAAGVYQTPGHMMSAGDGKMPGEMNREYLKAIDGMHGPMAKGIMDPDPDTAFVKGMIPHHMGAVEMAKIELLYGKDQELRTMAQDIIDAQQKEITFMQNWLKTKESR